MLFGRKRVKASKSALVFMTRAKAAACCLAGTLELQTITNTGAIVLGFGHYSDCVPRVTFSVPSWLSLLSVKHIQTEDLGNKYQGIRLSL